MPSSARKKKDVSPRAACGSGSASCTRRSSSPLLFFFNDTATTEIYTLSLHDALPIYRPAAGRFFFNGEDVSGSAPTDSRARASRRPRDRKSTRLNSSHVEISYAVFCLKKKKKDNVHLHFIKKKKKKK